jgi:hypothetical protein
MKRKMIVIPLVVASLLLIVWCVLPDPKIKLTQVTIDTMKVVLQTQSVK